MSWPTAPLGDFCNVISGGTPKRTVDDYWNGDIPWVKISDMLQGEITSTDECITELGLRESPARLLEPGTLLLSIFATVGRTAILAIPAATNQAIVGLQLTTDALDLAYLRHFLDSQTASLKQKSRGVAQVNINTTILKQLRIPLPPLEEQRRIAAILDRGNQLSQLRERSRKTLEILKQAVFRSALASHEASSSGSTAVELGECLSFITSGGRGWSQYYADSGPRFIRSGDVRMNQINRLSPQYISPPDNAEARRTRILDGDVLLTITGSRIGRVAPAASDDSGAYVGTSEKVRPTAAQLVSAIETR